MTGRTPIEHLAPWLGLLGAGAGWGLAHQVGSNTVFDNCRTGSPLFVILVCLAGLLVSALGAWFSWDVWRKADETEGRRFLGLLGALLAALVAFATLLPAIASLLLPSCFG